VADALRRAAAGDGTSVLGPAPAPISSLRGRFRHHAIAKAPPGSDLARLMAAARDLALAETRLRVGVDVDPLSML